MPIHDRYAFLDEALESRKKTHQFRALTSFIPDQNSVLIHQDGREFINFSSNDYLGLSHHPKVKEKAKTCVEKYGAGSGASRLVTGTYAIHAQLEQKLADVFNKEAALIFNSGFQANSTIIGTITDRHSLILADKLSHYSLLQGALSSRATFQRFDHNDVIHLEELLKKTSEKFYGRILIITETVFSMDGDRCPLPEISKLAQKYNALLFADDAHAVGIWGEKGLGLAADIDDVDMVLGTCGKAFGSFGAYVLCSKKMKDYLINFCPGLIYTTSLPPATIGSIDAALELIPTLNNERKAFHDRIKSFREELQEAGFDTGPSTTQIIPVMIGDEKRTLALADWLKGKGILATAIRPPTVPEQSSRIRITLSSEHSKEQLNYFVNTLKDWKRAES